VATLTQSVTCKRVMKSKQIDVKTLTSVTVSLKKIKRAYESVSQSIQRTKKCASTHNGVGFGAISVTGPDSSCGCDNGGQGSNGGQGCANWRINRISVWQWETADSIIFF